MNSVTIEIPEGYQHAFGSTEEEIRRNAKLELAISMYRAGRWSTRKAGEFAGMNRWQFMDVLMARQIEAPYTKEMLEQDLAYAFGRV
jgi:predicted HTH domain antitoxin